MNITIEFTSLNCNYCQFTFAVPASVVRGWRDCHNTFYCPSCKGGMGYTQQTNNEKLKKKVTRVQKQYEEKLACCVELQEENEHQVRRYNGLKGHITKLKKTNQKNMGDTK